MNNTTKVRNINKVIKDITSVLIKTKPIGVSVEPIATMTDPRNEIRGDYVIRACYWSNSEVTAKFDPKMRYCTVFEAYMIIESMQCMDDDRFQYNLKSLRTQAEAFRDQEGGGRDHMIVTGDEFVNMGDVVNKAHREIR